MIQGHSQETHGAAPVHRSTGDVERKAGHGSIHKDSKVVSEVSSCDSECPHTR